MSAVLQDDVSPAYRVIAPKDIDSIWEYIKSGIERSLETSNGEATAEDTRLGLVAGRTQLILFESDSGWCGVVFMFLAFPRFKIARVLLAFGREMSTMRNEFQEAELWAKSQGCRYVEAWVASPSRERLFARFGYQPSYRIIRKALK